MCSHFQQVCIEGNRKLISLLFLAHILTDLFSLCAKRRRNLSALFACPIPGFWWGSMWEIIIDIFLISLLFIFNKPSCTRFGDMPMRHPLITLELLFSFTAGALSPRRLRLHGVLLALEGFPRLLPKVDCQSRHLQSTPLLRSRG